MERIMNDDLELKTTVITSQAYTEQCDTLFGLFKLSRKAQGDPIAIYELQVGFATILMNLQNRKDKFKKANDEVGFAITNRLILVTKRVVDSMAWRVFGFNRVLLQLLAEHPSTGHLDNTVDQDLKTAKAVVEQEGAIPLITDLTSILRYGDVIVVNDNKHTCEFIENKSGKGSKRSGRASQQRHRLNKLLDFLNTKKRTVDGKDHYISMVDIPIKTHHIAVEKVINEARKSGYAQSVLSKCVAIEVMSFDSDAPLPKVKRPFSDSEHAYPFSNIDIFYKSASRAVPYGIFPVSDQNAFDLLTGKLLLLVHLNLDALKQKYTDVGMTYSFPDPTPQERGKYLAGTIAERKRLGSLHLHKIQYQGLNLTLTPDLFGRIISDLIHEDSIIEADKQLIELYVTLGQPLETAIRVYTGFTNENAIWA